MKHYHKSLLYDKNESWKKKKKKTDSCFDVIMGSYDEPEIWELVGSYISSLLSNFMDKNNCGLYCDNGLFFWKIPMERKWIKSEN